VSDPRRVVVVGAGVSGLAAAHRLRELAGEQKVPLDVQVFDADSRAGGVVRTRREDGFLWEEGPDSFITEKPWALDLCRRLGLEAELTGTNPRHQRSFVAWRGKLRPTPEGFYLLAPSRLWPLAFTTLFTPLGKLRMALEPFVPRRRGEGDESLASFVRRRLGREALERMAQPMVAGVYAADPERLSLRATFPRFLEWESKHGSVIAGLRASMKARRGAAAGVSGPRYGLFVTLRSGLSRLVDELVSRVGHSSVRLNTAVHGLAPSGRGWRLRLPAGAEREADAVCLALPAPRLAELIRPTDGEAAGLLDAVPYGASATVHVACRREDVAHPLDGFGFVVPAVEGRSLIGCSFSSVKFPARAPAGWVLLRAFVGGPRSEALLRRDDAALAAAVVADLRELLGVSGAPRVLSVRRWFGAMPHYAVGHLDRLDALDARLARHPTLALAGNGLRGLGLPDCVRAGEAAAEKLFRALTAAA
jgi:oxygen-dependent protoporphyrinogen oxidase